MLSFEEKFKAEYPDCGVIEETISSNLTRYRVVLGKIEFSESGVRDLAFKYALEEAKELSIPALKEQMRLWA